jgi:SOS response regulatory protein OraA/RecX
LRRLGYVNDEAVALRIAQARLARRPMGREALAAELKAREFSVETSARAVRAAYEGKSDREIAEGVLRSVSRRYADPEREKRRRAGLLKGRGFSDEVIEAVIGSAANCQVFCR